MGGHFAVELALLVFVSMSNGTPMGTRKKKGRTRELSRMPGPVVSSLHLCTERRSSDEIGYP